jgi:hypothetical protein
VKSSRANTAPQRTRLNSNKKRSSVSNKTCRQYYKCAQSRSIAKPEPSKVSFPRGVGLEEFARLSDSAKLVIKPHAQFYVVKLAPVQGLTFSPMPMVTIHAALEELKMMRDVRDHRLGPRIASVT